MKTTYIERGEGYTRAHGFVSHDNLQPVPQERPEDIFFKDTTFKPEERPKPQLAVTNT